MYLGSITLLIMLPRYLLFLLPFFIFQVVSAQSSQAGELIIGKVEKIDSKILEQVRILNIYLPQGYQPDSGKTYPTIYVLDGSAHQDFLHIAGLAQFLNMYELLPPSIVVGIANIDRYHDFTHVSTDSRDLEDIPTSGGSEKFIRFIETEVQPFVAQHYATNDQRTLIGQSLGGLLGTEILIRHSHLFSNYVLVSPSLWWGKQALLKSAKSYLANHPELKKRIFLTVGDEHPVMVKTAQKLAEYIKKSENEHLELYFEPLPQENHATILHRAVYRAMECFYPQPKGKQ